MEMTNPRDWLDSYLADFLKDNLKVHVDIHNINGCVSVAVRLEFNGTTISHDECGFVIDKDDLQTKEMEDVKCATK